MLSISNMPEVIKSDHIVQLTYFGAYYSTRM